MNTPSQASLLPFETASNPVCKMELNRRHIASALIPMLQVFNIHFGLQQRTILFHGFSNCSDDAKNPIHFNGNSSFIARNKYVVNGGIDQTKQFSRNTTKCPNDVNRKAAVKSKTPPQN